MDCQGAGHHSGNRGEALANEKSQQGRACDQYFWNAWEITVGEGEGNMFVGGTSVFDKL